MKCSWTFKAKNVYSRGPSCPKEAKFTVEAAPLCRVHAADRIFDNVINSEEQMHVVGLVPLP